MQHPVLIAFFVFLYTTAISAAVAQAQQPAKMPRVGYFSSSDSRFAFAIFQQGLRDHGYIEGKNIVIEYRTAEAKQERIPGLLAELAQLKVDALVVTSQRAIERAKQTIKTIPIVMLANFDPVAVGIIDSLARPGGNITGLSTLQRELSGKRLELLKEAVPAMARVGLLWDPSSSGPPISFKEYEAAALALKIPLHSLTVQRANPDFEGVFRAAVKGRVSAIIGIANSLLHQHQKRIADLTIKHRLPSMYERIDYVQAGGLLSYASDDDEIYRRAAYFVDRILKGTKPADLPVEQPKKFEFAINLKTAKQIGLTIPPEIVARANILIR
jgi:putative ABC transport system substrate-binding protein